MFDPTIAALEAVLAAHPGAPAESDLPPRARAAVALLVRPAGDQGLELLLIHRAEREGDPWSGHMALPGGRADPADPDAAATAVRETREEVGIDLVRAGRLLGILDEVAPQSGAPRVAVTPLVFAVPPGVEPVPNHEVQAAVWIRLAELTDPGATVEYLHHLAGGARMRFPAYGTRGYVIWGLTYRILTRFLELHALAGDPGPAPPG